MKVNESITLELEVQRLREENADLRRRASEMTAVESSKVKLQVKVDQLENKVIVLPLPIHMLSC